MHRHSTKCLPSAGGSPEAAVASIHFTIGAEVQEAAARAELEAAGFHVIAFDDVHDVDEDLHWHEFSSSRSPLCSRSVVVIGEEMQVPR